MKILFGWLIVVTVMNILGTPFLIGKEREPRTGDDYVFQLIVFDIPLLIAGLWYLGAF